MEYQFNILYDEIDIIINNLEIYDKIKLSSVSKFFNNKINKLTLKINNMNIKLCNLQNNKNNYINKCINDKCNIKLITKLPQQVFGLTDIDQLYNVNNINSINYFYKTKIIRFIPYCICCTHKFILI